MTHLIDREKEDYNELIISYKTLRMLVGIMGFFLPVSMLLSTCCGYARMQGSISDFYYTHMGDVFVGTLCAIALFLSTYNGYEKIDGIASRLAAGLALMVAFFPTHYTGSPCDQCSFHATQYDPSIGHVHLICASLLFLDLALMSLFLFTKTEDEDNKTPRKKIRNGFYIVCGIIMIASLLVLGVYFLFQDKLAWMGEHNIIFWLETVMLFAFGTSWLVKAEVILKDK